MIMLLESCLIALIVMIMSCPRVCITSMGREREMKCTKQSDCVNPESDRCAICVDDLSSKSGRFGKCILIQGDIYISEPSCVKYPCTYDCDNGRCMTTGDDIDDPTQYFVPYCKCNYGTLYNGNYCMKTYVKDPLLIAVRRRYDGSIVKAGEETLFNFQILSSSTTALSSIRVYFKVGDLPLRNYYITGVKQVEDVFMADLTPSFVFIYKRDNSTYHLKRNPIGYNTNIYLTIYSSILLYNNTWQVFVSYDGMICMPTIEVLNCGKTSENSVPFTRSSEIRLEVIVDYDSSRECHGEEKVSWSIWKIVNGGTHGALYENAEVLQRNIYLEPFKFQSGAYIVNVLVTNTKDKPIKNANWCYFKITCQPLVAKIFGGSDIMINPKDGLTLRADQSNDPNSPADSQSHVKTEWTCFSETGKKEGVCDPKQLPASEHYFIEGNLLTAGADYNFTLKVWTDLYTDSGDCETSKISPKFAYLNVRVAKEPDKNYRGITVRCLENCGQKVISNRKLHLKAVEISNITKGIKYKWSINGDRTITIESIAETVPSSSLLSIKENALSMGSNYTIRVEVQNSSWYTTYSFETYSMDYSVNCKANPKSGTKGLTPFKFNCEVPENRSQTSLVFNFFDKTDEEAKLESMFSGRLLGTSLDGVLDNVRLTRGQVCIYILNEHGLYLKIIITVKLLDWDIDHVILNTLYDNVTHEIRSGTTSTALASLSFIPEIIPPKMANNKSAILNTLIRLITPLQLKTFVEMELSVSTLSNVLLTMNKPNHLTLKPDLMAEVFKVIKHQGAIVFQKISSGEYKVLGTKEVNLVLIGVLNSIESVLECKDNMFDNINEDNIEPFTARQLRDGSMYLEETLDSITKTLGFLQVTGHYATIIKSNNDKFVIWILLTDEINVISDLVSKEKNIPIVLGGKLCEDLNGKMNKNEEMTVYVVSSKQNIYWWSMSNIRSRLVSVTMNRQISKTTTFPIRYVDKPMEIILNIDDEWNTTKIERNMHQLDPHNMDLTRLDLAIDVYRIDVPPRSLVSIKFIYPPTSAPLRVFVDSQFRPDYEIMTKKAVSITQSSPVYHVQYHEYEEPYFLFMGVIPGSEVEVNQSVTYAFQLNTSLCQTWAKGVWSSSGCHVKQVYNHQTRCQCTHFSTFAAAFPVPPNAIDPFSDAKLFLTVIENPLVVALVTLILVIYFLLCLTCSKSDRKNKKKREVIILEDNFPNFKIPYLIAVYTSARYNAGTTSHVGLQLIGEDYSSSPHILQSSQRKVLQTNNDDWFVLYSNEPLGELKGLLIWLDYSGPSPEWFCNRIFVFDLHEKTKWLFVIDEWLALSANYYPEALVFPTAVEDDSEAQSVFVQNIVLGFTEKHTIFSSLASHPRDEVSRVHRISIMICGVMVALLCNIMFFLPNDELNSMDDYKYSIKTREMYVSIQTVVIFTIVNGSIFILFNRSYKQVNNKPVSNVLSLGEVASSGSLKKGSLLKTFYNKFVRMVKKTTRTRPMTPVSLPGSQSLVEVRMCWLILAWTTCTSIIVICSYLVMLYGLKLGSVSGKKWLSSVLIGLSGDALIFTPMRIVFMSILLAVASQRIYELNNHQVVFDEVLRMNNSNDPEDIIKAFELRKTPMYKPMIYQRRNYMVRRRDKKEKCWNIIDFTNSVFLAIVVNNIILQQWTSHFHLNFQNLKLMTQPSSNYFGRVDFFSVSNIKSLERYLEFTFVDSLYNLWWYNGKRVNVEDNDSDTMYWARDYTNHILGLPVVRQFRIIPRKCENIVLKRRKCIPNWRNIHEDTDDYGERWKPMLWSDASRTNSPWKYTVKSDYFWLHLYQMYSPSGKPYTSGGYIQLLGMTSKQSSLKLAELRQNSWLDERTRAVFIEMTFYNVNLDLLTHVTLITEFTITGNVLLLARAVTVLNGMPITFWTAMFFIVMVYYIFRSYQLINREGPILFFSSCSNILRGLIVFLMIASLTLNLIDDYSSSLYFKVFERSVLDRYFDFHYFVKYTVLLRHALGFLLRAAFLHMFVLLQSGSTAVNQVYLFRFSLMHIFWITVMIVVIITALVKLASLASLPFTLESIIIIKQPLELLKTEDFECLGVKIFVISKTILITTCLWCYVMTFTWYTTTAKTGLARPTRFSFTSFVKNMFVKRNK